MTRVGRWSRSSRSLIISVLLAAVVSVVTGLLMVGWMEAATERQQAREARALEAIQALSAKQVPGTETLQNPQLLSDSDRDQVEQALLDGFGIQLSQNEREMLDTWLDVSRLTIRLAGDRVWDSFSWLMGFLIAGLLSWMILGWRGSVYTLGMLTLIMLYVHLNPGWRVSEEALRAAGELQPRQIGQSSMINLEASLYGEDAETPAQADREPPPRFSKYDLYRLLIWTGLGTLFFLIIRWRLALILAGLVAVAAGIQLIRRWARIDLEFSSTAVLWDDSTVGMTGSNVLLAVLALFGATWLIWATALRRRRRDWSTATVLGLLLFPAGFLLTVIPIGVNLTVSQAWSPEAALLVGSHGVLTALWLFFWLRRRRPVHA